MDALLLRCFLAKSGDEKNQMLLFSSKLIVFFKGNKTEFEYAQISSIVVGHKKLIIPLVLGGIGTSFSMLALSVGWYHYQLNLFSVFAFFCFMYYGFIGKDAVLIGEKGQDHVFLTNANKTITTEFVNFLKERMWKLKTPIHDRIYHMVDKGVWEKQHSSYHFQHPNIQKEGFIHCSTQDQLMASYEKYYNGNSNMLLIAINPHWVLSEVKWEYSNTRKSDFPHIYGSINKSSIIWVLEVASQEGLQKSIGSFS